MPLTPQTLADLTRYWTHFFGCAPTALAAAGTRVVPHAELENYRGLYCFRCGPATLVSAPPDELAQWQARLATLATDLLDARGMARQLGVPRARVIGPALIGYADAATLLPLPTPGTRLLSAGDEPAHAGLQAACPPKEWAHGGSEFGVRPLAGRFVRDMLVALAGYELWGDRIAHLAVVTHPAHRGQGHGAEAASLLAETLIARGLIVQYRTLRSNTRSRRLGASLGVVPYAETLAIRLGR